MEASQHPEYPQESQRLTQTERDIAQALQQLEAGQVNQAAHWSAMPSSELERYRRLRQSQGSPYFGRIDFSEDAGTLRTIYIGYHTLDTASGHVYSWRSPAGQLFYQHGYRALEPQSYRSAHGEVSGSILLKRRYIIDKSVLLDISDDLNILSNSLYDTADDRQAQQDFLVAQLYSRNDPYLYDIVATIQSQQDSLIRAPAQGVCIISGVAGSAKTAIAHHRLAYLLDPENGGAIRPEHSLVIVPNRLLLRYVQGLLPRLGVQGVQQMTRDDWLLEQLPSLRSRYRLHDAARLVLADANSSVRLRSAYSRRAKLKGSAKMLKVLRRYLEWRQQQIHLPRTGLRYRYGGGRGQPQGTIQLSYSYLQNLLERLQQQALPWMRQREQFVARLQQQLGQECMRHLGLEHYAKSLPKTTPPGGATASTATLPALLEPPQKLSKQLPQQPRGENQLLSSLLHDLYARLHADLDRLWPPLQLRDDYYALLADRATLRHISQGILSEQDVQVLSNLDSVPTDSIDVEDLAALYGLQLLGYGKGKGTYDHIVIDEAQDFSPLEIYLLKLHSRDQSMTLLGDPAQAISSHGGISQWQQLAPLFPHLQRFDIQQNYRATREIVLFCNEVLRSTQPAPVALAQPYQRFGMKPKVVEATNHEAMYSTVAEDITALVLRDISNIAVIAKSDEACQQTAKALLQRGVPVTATLTQRQPNGEYPEYQGGIVVIAAALCKGLEFQAALVVDVSAKVYSGKSSYDGKLLYVAITRALHYLNVYAVGTLSPFLSSAKHTAVSQRV